MSAPTWRESRVFSYYLKPQGDFDKSITALVLKFRGSGPSWDVSVSIGSQDHKCPLFYLYDVPKIFSICFIIPPLTFYFQKCINMSFLLKTHLLLFLLV